MKIFCDSLILSLIFFVCFSNIFILCSAITCSPGMYSSTGSECQDCQSGLSSTNQGAIACTSNSTTTCPSGSGKIEGVQQGCYACAAGMYQDGTALMCAPCSGELVSGTSAAVCTATCAFDRRDRKGGLGSCRYHVLWTTCSKQLLSYWARTVYFRWLKLCSGLHILSVGII